MYCVLHRAEQCQYALALGWRRAVLECNAQRQCVESATTAADKEELDGFVAQDQLNNARVRKG